MLKSTNGGQSWTNYSPLSNPPGINGVFFLNKDTGFFVGNDRSLHETRNGCTSWSTASWGNAFVPTNDIYCLDYDNRYFIGDKGYFENLFDYGVNEDYNLYAADFRGGKGVVVGENSILLPFENVDEGVQWASFLSPKGTSILATYYDVQFIDDNSFIAVGKEGRATKFYYPEL